MDLKKKDNMVKGKREKKSIWTLTNATSTYDDGLKSP
jgi:hypothetical protein